jgi:prolyl oligopeptidase
MFRNSGLEPQGKYFVRKGETGAEEIFLDINALSTEGTTAASLLGADDSNRYMAVSVNEAGSDWGRIEVFDIATKTRLSDRLEWVKFSGATWYKDGFFYNRYPAPEKGKNSAATTNITWYTITSLALTRRKINWYTATMKDRTCTT